MKLKVLLISFRLYEWLTVFCGLLPLWSTNHRSPLLAESSKTIVTLKRKSAQSSELYARPFEFNFNSDDQASVLCNVLSEVTIIRVDYIERKFVLLSEASYNGRIEIIHFRSNAQTANIRVISNQFRKHYVSRILYGSMDTYKHTRQFVYLIN